MTGLDGKERSGENVADGEREHKEIVVNAIFLPEMLFSWWFRGESHFCRTK